MGGENENADRELRAHGIDPERLRELAPGLAAAIERRGLQAATEARLRYLATDPRLLRDVRGAK